MPNNEEFPPVDELEEEEVTELFPGPEAILAEQRLALTDTGQKIQEVESRIISVSEQMERAQQTMSTIGGFFTGLKEMIFAPGEYIPPGALGRLSTERNALIDELEILSDQQVRNLWGMSLYEALPMKIQQGEITSYEDLLAHPAFRLPSMTEADRAAARQAYDSITGAIGRAGVADKPDATQQDIIQAMAKQYRPQVPLAGVHQLSVEELVKGFQARYQTAPPALSLAEVNAVYREAGMPEELIQEAQDLAKMSADYDAYWAEVLSSQELTKAGLEEARMPEMSLKDQLLMAIESPGLLALDAFGGLARHWIWPWASTTFRARIALGQAIGRPLNKYEQNFMAIYEEARATDDWWHAGGKAWEEAELGWGNRLVYEWVLDPLNLIGFGVYTKVAGKIPWAGKWLGPLAGRLEFGWVKAWDRMIFDPIKRAVRRIPKTPMQAARSVAGEDFKNVISYVSIASGGKYYTQVPLDDVGKLLIRARNFALKHPEDLGPMGRAGRAMLRQTAIDESGVKDMLTKVGVTLDVPISRDMLTSVNIILSEVSGLTTGRLLTLKTAPPLLLRALTAHETAESLKAAKGILTTLYRNVIKNSNNILRKSNSVAKLMSNIYDNTQTIAFKSSESLAAHNLEMTGKLMSIGSNIKWTTMNIWRTQIDKWAVTPFARMYLVFAAYGPFNALEGYMKPVFARVNPFWKKGVDPIRKVQVKWAGTLKPLDIETAIPYIQISPEIPSALGIERSSAALIKWRRFWSAYNVGDWMVDRWGRLGAQQRSNYWDKLATRYLAEEEAPDLMRVLATRIDDFVRGISDGELASLRLTRAAYKSELLDRAMSGTTPVRDMINDAVAARIAKTGVSKNTALGDNIAAGHVQELAANYTLVPDAIQENAVRRAADGRLWANAGAGIDDFYENSRLLLYDNFLTSPELFQSRYSKLAKDLIDTVPANRPEFLEKLKMLDDMVNFYSESSSKVIRGARELADEMHIYAGDYESLLAKQQYYDNVWTGLKGYMDSADDTFARTVDNMKLNMELVKLPADQRETVLKLFDMWTDQVKLTKATRLSQRSAEETLLAATPPGRARDAIFWQRFREAQAKPWRDWELSMAGLKEKTFIQQDMASRILGTAGPPPPMVDAAGRQLTKMDVATIFQSHPRSMPQAVMHMENMTIKGKPQFIAEVRAQAEIMAKAAGRSADDLGFTRANIEAVYDQVMGDMLIDPARASVLEPQLMELNALKSELWNVYDTKGLPRGTVEAMNERLSGLADDLSKVPGYMAPPPKAPPAMAFKTPDEAMATGKYLARGDIPWLAKDVNRKGLGAAGGSWATNDLDVARGYGAKISYFGRPRNPAIMEIDDAFRRYVPGVTDFAEATDANWAALRRRLLADGYDALEITSPFTAAKGKPVAKDTWFLKRPKMLSLADLPGAPPIKGLTIRHTAQEIVGDFHIEAKLKGEVAGALNYSVRGNYMTIRMINVSEAMRRRGVASSLIDDIVRRSKAENKVLLSGPLTDEGKALFVGLEKKGLIKLSSPPDIPPGPFGPSRFTIEAPPIKPPAIAQLSDDFLASRQRAADKASKEYFKDWADYTNETALTALGRTVYPFWVYETHRLFWVPRNMIRFPGMFKAWGSYMSNTEDGYIPIPGTSLQVNPLRGTIWMGGAIRLIRQDYPEYYDMVPGVSETLDYLSRFGFYPAAYLNTIKAFAGARSARGRMLVGELLPATIKTPLNAYLAAHGDSKAAQALTQILVPDIYREYVVMIFASRLCQKRGLDFSGRHIWDKVKQGLKLTDEEQQIWGEATKKYGMYGILMEQGGIFRIRSEQQVEAWEEAGKLIEEATGITEEQQLWIRRHGYRVSDYAMVDPATQDLLQELDSIKYWSGIFTVLFPSSWQEEDRRRGLFWSSIRDLDDARLAEYVESDRRVSAGEISFRQWNRRNSQIASKFRSDFDAIAGSEEYRNIPIGLFDELDDEGNVTRKGLATVMEERGQLPPVQHPADEILNMYYSIELEEAFDSVTESWYTDWDSYFWKIDSIVTAVGEDRRPDLVAQITKNMSELRRLYWQVSREYFRPYNRVQTVQLELYDETQKTQIRRFLVTPSDAERDALREIVTPDGTKLISGYQAEVRQARENMRLLSPELDSWLLFFQITQKTLTDEAQRLYTENRIRYGIAP